MANFQQKKITKTQTLADQLKRVRLEKDISLAEVEECTKIQTKYLEILEEGNYKELPGDVYAKTWIKIYGEFLGLNTKELLVLYQIEKNISQKIKILDYNNSLIKDIFLLRPKTLKLVAIGIVILGLLTYLGYEVNNIVAAPAIVINEPVNNYVTTDNRIAIQGSTQTEAQLTINNEVILLDETGNFKQEINLVMGLNKLQISVKKKHSRTNNLEWQIVRESL